MSNYTDPFPDTDNEKDCNATVTTCDAESQTTLTMEDMEKEAQSMQNCTLELNQFKLQLLNVQISKQAFREKDDKTKFHTGIAIVLLTHVFNLVAKHIKHTSTNVLPPFLLMDVNIHERSGQSNCTRSLTHSLTHSILINLFIKLELNNFLLPPLLSIFFVQDQEGF